VGTQYRSEIFYTSLIQKETAANFIALLEEKKVFDTPIVTALSEEKPFYLAEEEHHDYYNNHKTQRYCQLVINPKIDKLHSYFKNKLNTN